MSLIFLLFILFLLFMLLRPVIRVLWQVNRQRKQWQDLFDRATGAASSAGRGRRPDAASAPGSGKKRRRKVFSRDEGEYVDFEEIEITETEVRYGSSAESGSATTERQVVDAEWEDIK